MTSDDRQFRPDVEGLRAVAVGLVVLCHAAVPGVAGGYVGVDVFFVLSGFLITGLLLRERATTGKTSLASFYGRRARRILPAASLVLLVTVFASYQWLGFLRGDAIAEDGKWTAMFAANLHFAREGTDYLGATAPPSPLQHYWSLAVEEQFYLAWPLVFLLAASLAPRIGIERKLAPVLVVTIVASFAYSVLQTGTNPAWAFFSPFTRAWELAAGALLAVAVPLLRRGPPRFAPALTWAGLGAILISAFAFDSATPFPGLPAMLPVGGAVLVLIGATIAPGAGAERLLALAPLQVLGKWSYALYLWHWPLLVIAAQRSPSGVLPLEENLVLVVAALALAAATHYVVENPIRFARPLARSPWASISVGAGLVISAYAFCAWQVSDSHSANGPALVLAAPPDWTSLDLPAAKEADDEILPLVAAASSIQGLPEDLVPGLEAAAHDFAWLAPGADGCLVDADVLESPPCVFGDPDGTYTVVLLGDSHAAQWLIAFDTLGKRLQWRIILLAKTACPAVSLDFSRAYGAGANKLIGAYPDCGRWLTGAIHRINQSNPDAVILASCNGCEHMVDSGGDPLTRQDWGSGLRATLSRIVSPGTTTVVLGDIPRWRGTLDCLALHQDDVQACSKDRHSVTAPTYNDIEAAVAQTEGADYIDVVPWFCTAVCPAVIGDMLAYTNDNHVTATYTNHLSAALASTLRPIVEHRDPAQP